MSYEFVRRDGCPLCKANDADVFIAFPAIPVMRCRQCAFMYSGRTLSSAGLHSYYENDFGGERHRCGQQINALTNFTALARLIDLKNIGSFLDVGTGYGFLLRELVDRYRIAATGVELSKQESSYGCSTLGLNVINSSLSGAGLQKNSYDLVAAFEVIEHVPYPLDFIRELTGYVKPGGYLVVMTDNFESRVAKSLGAGFPKWIPHAHISHFSSSTLQDALASSSNLRLIRAMSYTPWETLLRAAVYALLGIRKSPSESFDLQATLDGEMVSAYRLFKLRKILSKLWVSSTLSEKTDGSLMYFLAQRIG